MVGGNPHPVDGTKNLIHAGRPKGAKSKYKRALRHALILAAEASRNSKSGDLFGYCLYLADERPELFVSMLARIIPLQAKIRDDNEFHYSDIHSNMPLSEMITVFAARIKEPPIIEHEEGP